METNFCGNLLKVFRSPCQLQELKALVRLKGPCKVTGTALSIVLEYSHGEDYTHCPS